MFPNCIYENYYRYQKEGLVYLGIENNEHTWIFPNDKSTIRKLKLKDYKTIIERRISHWLLMEKIHFKNRRKSFRIYRTYPFGFVLTYRGNIIIK